jgi:hypothetical protein
MIPRTGRIALGVAASLLLLVLSTNADARQFTRLIVKKLDGVRVATLSPQIKPSLTRVRASARRMGGFR